VVVLETGLGGRLDASNIREAGGLRDDSGGVGSSAAPGRHALLRSRLRRRGFSSRGSPSVSGPRSPEVMEVWLRRAEETGCPLATVEVPWSGGRIGLKGGVQRWNAALAVAALRAARRVGGWGGDCARVGECVLAWAVSGGVAG
jgi:hypothetical protein